MLTRVWNSPEWPSFAGDDWQREIMDAPLADRLHVKQGRSIVRWTLRGAGGQLAVFVKRHSRHPLWQRLLAKMRIRSWSSDAGLELHHLHIARGLGVPSPEPMACAEWVGGPGKLQSVLVVKELAGMIALHDALPLAASRLTPAMFGRWKRALIRELVRLVLLMHEKAYFHRDLYLCHFYIAETDCLSHRDDWKGRVVLIDFHRLARQPLASFAGRAKDLAQLLFSAQCPQVSPRDVARFWKLYRGSRRKTLLRRLVAWKCGRYLRHNRKQAPA